MFAKGFRYLDRIVELTIFLFFAAMVIVGGMQVFNRFVLNQSLSWSEEFQKFAHIWLIFLAIPVGYNRASHIGMTLLVGKLPPALQKALALVTDLLWLMLALVVVYYTTVIMGVAKYQWSSGMRLRMDWVYSGLVLGGGYLALCTLRKLAGRLRPISGRTEGEA